MFHIQLEYTQKLLSHTNRQIFKITHFGKTSGHQEGTFLLLRVLWCDKIPVLFLSNSTVFRFVTRNTDKCGPEIFCETPENSVVAIPSSHIVIGTRKLFPWLFYPVCAETNKLAAAILQTALWNKIITILKIQILIKNIYLQSLWSLREIFFKHSM